jgi:hypothetical protein
MSRLLFMLGLTAAAVLLAAVLLAPLLHRGEAGPGAWPRLVALFAGDAVVRRTAVAGGLGLGVTACVFFRPSRRRLPGWRRYRRSRRPPPGGAGA